MHQRNSNVDLLRKQKKIFRNLNEVKICDNNAFYKKIKPYFKNKKSMSANHVAEKDKQRHNFFIRITIL